MTNTTTSAQPNGLNTQSVSSQSRIRSTSHPRFTLQQAEKLAKSVFDMGPRHCNQDIIAKQVGYSNANNGSYASLKATAVQFGMVVVSGGYISVSDRWIEVFNSEDDMLVQIARREAMQRPDLYKQLLSDYGNKQLPSNERLTRELHLNPKYGILKDAASVAAQTFIESANFALMLDMKGFLAPDGASKRHQEATDATIPADEETGKAFARANKQSPPQSNTPVTQNTSAQALLTSDDVDRIEIQLRNGKKAYLLIPVPLPYGEKLRLKGYIDLLLEEGPPSQNAIQVEQD